MNYSGVILAVVVSCVILANLSEAKKKAPSPPKWKASSMPFQNVRFQSELERNNVKLDCKSQGHPKPSIQWLKDGIPIRKNAPKMSTRKFGLMLENITGDMSGNYTCIVENKHGLLEWTFILDVQAAVWPLVVEGPKNVTQMVGANVAFQCRIINDPKATIRWQRINKKKGSKRSKSEFLPDGDDPQVLMIEDVQKEDEGEYRCMAGNFMGLKYSSAWLNVIEPVTAPPPPPTSTHGFDNEMDNTNLNVENKNEVDIFGRPFDPKIFKFDNNFYTTTRRPRNKNKGRGKNGRRKNKKIKNKIPKTRPPPTTTPLPTESSTFWWTEDTTPSTVSTIDFFNWQFSSFPTKIWTYPDGDNEDGGVRDTRYNPGRTNEVGNTGSAKEGEPKNDIEEWKIYTIVGAVGGVVLLIGLVAITIAVCCPKQEGAVYKSTPV